MARRRPEPIEEPVRQRPWDNAGLRNRVEGRAIEGVDVLELQLAVVERSKAERIRRRRRGRR
jgi:hypothetical protein